MKLIFTREENIRKLYMEYTYVKMGGLKEKEALELITEGSRRDCENTILLLKKYFYVEVIRDGRTNVSRKIHS